MVTWYVSTSGNNANDGLSVDAPKRDINAALAAVGYSAGAGAGDIVTVASGTYTETISNWPSGTSGNPFTLRSATQYGAILRPTGSSQILYFNANYVTVDGFVVDGVNTDANNVWFQAVTGVTFQNSEVKNVRTGGAAGIESFQAIYSTGASNCVIRANLIHDVGTSYSNHASHGIYWGSWDSIIEGNTIHTISGWGMQIFTAHGEALNNNIIRNNRIYNYAKGGSAGGIYIGNGTNNVAYNNIVYEPTFNSSAYGFIVADSGNKVFNNTVYNNAVGIDTSNASSAEVKNNIAYIGGVNFSSGTSFSKNLTTNPFFVNAGAGDFHLTAASTNAIDQGVVIN